MHVAHGLRRYAGRGNPRCPAPRMRVGGRIADGGGADRNRLGAYRDARAAGRGNLGSEDDAGADRAPGADRVADACIELAQSR